MELVLQPYHTGYTLGIHGFNHLSSKEIAVDEGSTAGISRALSVCLVLLKEGLNSEQKHPKTIKRGP